MRLNSTAARRYTAALALTFALGSFPTSTAAAERAVAAAASTAPAAMANVRIENFGRVNDHYYRGAQPKGGDFADLAVLGIKTVIDLAEEGDRAEEGNATKAGMKFVRIPMTTHETPGPQTIAKFLALVNDPASQPVYVHCMGGRHRTGVMTAIYRMTADAWTPLRAFSEMKQYKFGADFLHQEFKDFVLGFTAAAAPDGDHK
ncbi:MAG TPA: tyrosine-protein phosphatase [Vicinamibacterales bacterium]|nr:tyrosine-protein phosphatase [Vicinamibacterales bacterium]